MASGEAVQAYDGAASINNAAPSVIRPMVFHPQVGPLRRTLAALALAASGFLCLSPPAVAAGAAQPTIKAAYADYMAGKSLTGRRRLLDLIRSGVLTDPADRTQALEALLDICLHSRAEACLVEHVQVYTDAAGLLPRDDPITGALTISRAAYYWDLGRLARHRPEITAQILEWGPWRPELENAQDPVLHVNREILAARVLVALDRPWDATQRIDKALSMIASLENPERARLRVAWALSQAVALLLASGDTDRALAIRQATGNYISAALSPLSVDLAEWRMTEAGLLEQFDDMENAHAAAGEAAQILRSIELDDEVRDGLLANALSLKAVTCAVAAAKACIDEAFAAHPLRARYARPGRAPQSGAEIVYLVARALTAVRDGGQPDRMAAEALRRAPAFEPERAADEQDLAGLRALGLAASAQAGPSRVQAHAQLASVLAAQARASRGGVFGAWERVGALHRIAASIALGDFGNAPIPADDAFALFQILNRRGPSFETDALIALSQAKDDLQRRAIQDGLRLRHRRNRLEAAELRKVVDRAAAQPPSAEPLRYDPARREVFRNLSDQIGRAARDLAEAGISTSGANVVPLDRFTAVLGDDEAAITLLPARGGFYYLCVRRNGAWRAVETADLQQLSLDARLVQQALTAQHAPSEPLDAQFPAAAAVRLYDALVRPVEACLRPGDHIVWLPPAGRFPVPTAALLRSAPPRTAAGYDLGAADWLVKTWSVSYAGSAGLVLAARSAARPVAAGADFLGVGDPLLVGLTAGGEERAVMLLRGARGGALSALAPLPETRDELERSASGFDRVRLLTGADATERRFRGELALPYRYLSFATHGLLRDEVEGLAEPALALTPVSSAEPADDGLLTASEIADLHLAARFVALSACNTANYDYGEAANELPGLASAFAIAGVPATLATLWPVDSETSRRVVVDVFARLRAGRDPARALAEAQRAFLAAPPGQAWLHPRFWAPFLLLGDGEAGGALMPQSKPKARATL